MEPYISALPCVQYQYLFHSLCSVLWEAICNSAFGLISCCLNSCEQLFPVLIRVKIIHRHIAVTSMCVFDFLQYNVQSIMPFFYIRTNCFRIYSLRFKLQGLVAGKIHSMRPVLSERTQKYFIKSSNQTWQTMVHRKAQQSPKPVQRTVFISLQHAILLCYPIPEFY